MFSLMEQVDTYHKQTQTTIKLMLKNEKPVLCRTIFSYHDKTMHIDATNRQLVLLFHHIHLVRHFSSSLQANNI